MPPVEGGITSCADVAQLVEHVLGKDGVSGSIPLIGSRDLIEARTPATQLSRFIALKNAIIPNMTKKETRANDGEGKV